MSQRRAGKLIKPGSSLTSDSAAAAVTKKKPTALSITHRTRFLGLFLGSHFSIVTTVGRSALFPYGTVVVRVDKILSTNIIIRAVVVFVVTAAAAAVGWDSLLLCSCCSRGRRIVARVVQGVTVVVAVVRGGRSRSGTVGTTAFRLAVVAVPVSIGWFCCCFRPRPMAPVRCGSGIRMIPAAG